jgi:hypothetical protein
MNIQPFAWGVFLSAAVTVNAGERLTIAASPLQSFAPTNVSVRVHVPPDDANRALEVSADSGEYYRSSLIQLAGKDAPRTITVEFQRLPGGQYEIRGALLDSVGHARAFARQQVTVLPSAGDADETFPPHSRAVGRPSRGPVAP